MYSKKEIFQIILLRKYCEVFNSEKKKRNFNLCVPKSIEELLHTLKVS